MEQANYFRVFLNTDLFNCYNVEPVSFFLLNRQTDKSFLTTYYLSYNKQTDILILFIFIDLFTYLVK